MFGCELLSYLFLTNFTVFLNISVQRRLSGRLSPRALGLVAEWAALHRAELMEDWNLARAEAQLKPIAPLE